MTLPYGTFRTLSDTFPYSGCVARIDIRLTAEDKEWLAAEARERGVSLSELVRGRVLGERSGLAVNQDQLAEGFNDHERRLSRLEEMAGL